MPRTEPRYREVKRRLTDSLRAGEWKYGQLVPGEPALAARYGVSVGTLRRAVDELVAERILVRKQGRGTFVASHTRDTMLAAFFQIVDRDGHKEFPRSELLGFHRARADAATAASLDVAPGAPLFQVDNRLWLRGEPVIVDRIRLSASLFPDLTESLFAQRDTTIYGMYQMRYGITVVRVEESITAALADERARALLRLADPAAVLRIVRTAYTYEGVPVDTRVRVVSTRDHRYLSVLGQRRGAPP